MTYITPGTSITDAVGEGANWTSSNDMDAPEITMKSDFNNSVGLGGLDRGRTLDFIPK